MVLEYIKVGSSLIAIIAGIYALYKYFKRDELFPRIQFDVDIHFIGSQNDEVVLEIIALIENKGVVPIKLDDLRFSLRSIKADEELSFGTDNINGQLLFETKVKDSSWIGQHWNYTFVYPGVKTRYTHATKVPKDTAFLLLRGIFLYKNDDDFHTSAKIFKIPNVFD